MKPATPHSPSSPPPSAPAGYFPPGFDAAAVRNFYDRNGYFVVEAAFAPAEVEALKAEAVAICRGQRGVVEGSAPSTAAESDDDVLRRYLCIHFPHKISPLIHATLFNGPVVRALAAVVGPNVKCMQSMLFIKASGRPGQAWHQDEDYIPTRDRSLIGAWIALDRATPENGGLWIIPGSHRPGVLWDQHWHGDRRFDCAEEARGFPYAEGDAVPVEVEAGSVVFFNGYTLHRSLPNRAPAGTYRRALVNHYMSCESFLPWRPPQDATPMAKVDHRDVVIVAGTDPYAHHGYASATGTFLRLDGKSGCLTWVEGKGVPGAYAGEGDEQASRPVPDRNA